MERADPNAIYALLQRLNIPFRKAEHPAASSMEDLSAVEAQLRQPGASQAFCKNLFLCNRQKTVFYLLLIREDKRFKTSVVSKLIGASRLSFGEEDKLYALLGVHPGAITPLGLVFDAEHQVRLLMERGVYEAPFLSCHPCICTSSLKLKMSDVLAKLLPHTGHEVTVVDLPDE